MLAEQEVNPITGLDYPDPDVIRVGEVYYMVTTTMHFMPGCEIMRSYDLVHWEHAAFVYETLDSTPGQTLTGEQNIYGKGMWAASLRFHKGIYYICFVANDTGRTYLYTADRIEGPWKKRNVEGFYHDCSLLFDEDKVYIAYGNRDIYITQLKPDLSGPMEGGLHRLAVSDAGNLGLGYEGAHFYKINGRYYLFLIHSLRDRWMRVQACFMADSIEGAFTGGDVLEDDRGYCGQGVAQGGIVDTPEGAWYAVLFQDYGAVGRIPVLVPVVWNGDFPVFGECGRLPSQMTVPPEDEEYLYVPLTQSDDFQMRKSLSPAEERRQYGCFGLKSVWQFNHEPELSLVSVDRENGTLWIESGKLCDNLTQARNVLTQRMRYPGCAGEVTVDAGALEEGDYAGICALQGCYGMVAVTKREGNFYIVMKSREADDVSLQAMPADTGAGTEWERLPLEQSSVKLRVEADFVEMTDEVRFMYYNDNDNGWKPIGRAHKLYFKMDHFTGCRFGLFLYATQQTGGRAGFRNFIYEEK